MTTQPATKPNTAAIVQREPFPKQVSIITPRNRVGPHDPLNALNDFEHHNTNHCHNLNIGDQTAGKPALLPWPAPHIQCSTPNTADSAGWVNSIIDQLAPRTDTAILATSADSEVCGFDLWRPRLTDLATTPTDAAELIEKMGRLIEERHAIMRSKQTAWTTDLGPWILLAINNPTNSLGSQELANGLFSAPSTRKAATAGITFLTTTVSNVETQTHTSNLDAFRVGTYRHLSRSDIADRAAATKHLNWSWENLINQQQLSHTQPTDSPFIELEVA